MIGKNIAYRYSKLFTRGFIMWGIICGIVVLVILSILFLVIVSPGKIDQLTDSNGHTIPNSISEKVFIEINGIKQGMFIQGESLDYPVLLFLHGGPGSPEFLINQIAKEKIGLEKEFIVCYWEQRGAGMSFSSKINVKEMNVQQMIEDTKKVTDYLKERFNQDKIFILGHSWGTYLGIKTIEQFPNDYYAYIGMGQISNQKQSEKLAYEYMLEYAEKTNDKKAIKSLSKFNKEDKDFPTNRYVMGIRSSLMNQYGIGIMHNDFSIAKLAKMVIFFKGYTFKEKINYLRGSAFSIKYLFQSVTFDDLNDSSNQFEIPIYVLHGVYDYQVSHDLAKEYSKSMKAPKKVFYSFNESAHSPLWEEPLKFMEIIKEIKYTEK